MPDNHNGRAPTFVRHERIHTIVEDPDLWPDIASAHGSGVARVRLNRTWDIAGHGWPHMCLGDFDASTSVGFSDMLTLLSSWGACPPKGLCLADLDDDGLVSFSDLLGLLSRWGPCEPKQACPTDLDFSGEVGFSELLAVLSTWGPC